MNKEIEKLKTYFNKKLENYEIDKKFRQLSPDSIYSLFPTETKLLLDYINQLERKNEILEATQYCPYDKDCGKLYDCTKEEYQKMCEVNVDLMAKIDQLETKINEVKNECC